MALSSPHTDSPPCLAPQHIMLRLCSQRVRLLRSLPASTAALGRLSSASSPVLPVYHASGLPQTPFSRTSILRLFSTIERGSGGSDLGEFCPVTATDTILLRRKGGIRAQPSVNFAFPMIRNHHGNDAMDEAC